MGTWSLGVSGRRGGSMWIGIIGMGCEFVLMGEFVADTTVEHLQFLVQ